MDANHDLEAAHWKRDVDGDNPDGGGWSDECWRHDTRGSKLLPASLVRAIRADERRASEERERALQSDIDAVLWVKFGPAEQVTDDEYEHVVNLFKTRRALLIPENAGDAND